MGLDMSKLHKHNCCDSLVQMQPCEQACDWARLMTKPRDSGCFPSTRCSMNGLLLGGVSVPHLLLQEAPALLRCFCCIVLLAWRPLPKKTVLKVSDSTSQTAQCWGNAIRGHCIADGTSC